MIKPKVISTILSQALGKGETASLLIRPDGSLLASSGSDEQKVSIYAAIASNICTFYKDLGQNQLNDELNKVMLECEEGKIVIYKVASLLLCLVGDQTTQFGMLWVKVKALATHIEVPLKQLEDFI
ncbi:mitogen-activated protein-binding protein-interacting protein [Neoconidiobolus thromboides FSU 785]|nr:mitogen-activated protein-binding protein-interacting protein [Neoconidiobolus thromboides FSU 785]